MLEYDNNYIRRLIQLDLVGGLSPEEKGKLEDWINESEEHRLLFCKIKKQLSINEIRNYLQTDVEDAWKKVREKTFGAPPVRPRIRPKWLKYAAVVLPVLLSITLWYTWKEEMKNKQATVARLNPVLTLDNGEKYQLDPEEQTEIYVNEEVKAYQAGGGLIYDTTARQEENKYNRIEVPRGSEYWIVLPDGTRVWLNAETELTYPTVFGKGERKLMLKGEACFEVVTDTARPFIVESFYNRVEVLGTRFNVSAYTGKSAVKTTLLRGKVKVSNRKGQLVLSPGEQAVCLEEEIEKCEVDARAVAAWVDGTFEFENMSLGEITDQLGRWYDVDFVFADPQLKAITFTGAATRYRELDFVLRMLEELARVRFQLENKTIRVSKI